MTGIQDATNRVFRTVRGNKDTKKKLFTTETEYI